VAARTYSEAGLPPPRSCISEHQGGGPSFSGRKRSPWDPEGRMPERRGGAAGTYSQVGARRPAFCWSRVSGPRPSTSGRFDRPGLGLRAPGKGGERGRSEVFRGGARFPFPGKWPEPLGHFRGRVRPPGHHVWCLGAIGTYSRVGPEGSVGKPAHRAGGCAGPLGLIPRRGPRPSNRSAEPPGRIPGSGSVGLYNLQDEQATRRKTQEKTKPLKNYGYGV